MTELAAAVIGALVGGLVTFSTTRWQIRKELEFEYDKDLRERRIAEYRKLWKLVELFALYSRPVEAVTHGAVRRLSNDLRHWYFHDGGFYLSVEARDAYFALQEALVKELQASENPSAAISEVVYERVRKQASALRTSLVADVGTRRAPAIHE